MPLRTVPFQRESSLLREDPERCCWLLDRAADILHACLFHTYGEHRHLHGANCSMGTIQPYRANQIRDRNCVLKSARTGICMATPVRAKQSTEAAIQTLTIVEY